MCLALVGGCQPSAACGAAEAERARHDDRNPTRPERDHDAIQGDGPLHEDPQQLQKRDQRKDGCGKHAKGSCGHGAPPNAGIGPDNSLSVVDDSNVRGCWKAVCLNQNTAIDHLFPSNLLPDDHVISYGAKSAVGTKQTCRSPRYMSVVEMPAQPV